MTWCKLDTAANDNRGGEEADKFTVGGGTSSSSSSSWFKIASSNRSGGKIGGRKEVVAVGRWKRVLERIGRGSVINRYMSIFTCTCHGSQIRCSNSNARQSGQTKRNVWVVVECFGKLRSCQTCWVFLVLVLVLVV